MIDRMDKCAGHTEHGMAPAIGKLTHASANASRLEHSSTRLAAISVRKPSETRS